MGGERAGCGEGSLRSRRLIIIAAVAGTFLASMRWGARGLRRCAVHRCAVRLTLPATGARFQFHRGRQRADLVGSADADDVADPIGGPLDRYRKTARQLGNLVNDVASLLWVPGEIATLPG